MANQQQWEPWVKVEQRGVRGKYWEIITGQGDWIADVPTDALADQIIAEHNAARSAAELREALLKEWWEEQTDKAHLRMFPRSRCWCHFCRQTGPFPVDIKHAPKCIILTLAHPEPTEAHAL